jgi:hypothetical protein
MHRHQISQSKSRFAEVPFHALGSQLMRVNEDFLVLYETQHDVLKLLASRLIAMTPDERKLLLAAVSKCESSLEHSEAALTSIRSAFQQYPKP